MKKPSLNRMCGESADLWPLADAKITQRKQATGVQWLLQMSRYVRKEVTGAKDRSSSI